MYNRFLNITVWFSFIISGCVFSQNWPGTNGNESISRIGNVGIGLSSTPNYTLDVNGITRIYSRLLLGAYSYNNNADLNFWGDGVRTLIQSTRSDNTQAGTLSTNGWGDFSFNKSLGIGYNLSNGAFGTGNLYIYGNVGIGTTTPNERLSVCAGSDVYIEATKYPYANGRIRVGVQSLYGVVDTYPGTDLHLRPGGNTIMALKSTGNVGIGTTSPGYKLEVNGSANFNDVTWHQNASWFGSSNANSGWILVTGYNDNSNYIESFNNQRNGSQDLKVTGAGANMLSTLSLYANKTFLSGNVGIGVTPYYKLHVNTNLGVVSGEHLCSFWEDPSGYEFGIGYRANGSVITHALLRSGYNRDLLFGTSGSTQAMVITNSGNVGIGTTSPNEQLSVCSGGDVYIEATKIPYANGRIRVGVASLTGVVDTYTGTDLSLRPGLNTSMTLKPNGNVGIGTTSPSEKLAVNGKIKTKEIIVTEAGWSDYVFEDNYPLMPLEKVEKHIQAEKHLPDIPSAREVEANGVSLGEMQAKLLKKIEELTLYAIEQNKRNDEQQKEIQSLKLQMEEMKKGK